MNINVTGRKMNVGEALTSHVEDRLDEVADKYFSRTIDASATFTKEGHIYRSDVSFHANQGVNLQSRGEADDPYAAFELAADKVEKQLRRYKRKIKNHHKPPRKDIDVELAHMNGLDFEVEDSDDANGGALDDQAIIIAENRTEIPHISVGDAATLMGMAKASAFMFKNTKNDTLEFVYRRSDGNIGWISPTTADN